MSGKIRFSGPISDPSKLGIKFPGGGDVSGVLQTLQDPSGNNLPMAVSTGSITIGTGVITSNGVLTIKSSGGNTVSIRSSANVEMVRFDGTGGGVFTNTVAAPDFTLNGGIQAIASTSGIIRLSNTSYSNLTALVLGTPDANGLSIYKNLTEMRVMIGNGLSYAPIRGLTLQTDKLSGGTLADSFPFRVGNIGAITDAAFLALGLNRQLAIENNGVICYIPFSTSLIP